MSTSFLLDTHSFIWWQAADVRFPRRVRSILLQPESRVFVSAVTCWEVITKFQLGKLKIPLDVARDIEAEVMKWGMAPLPVTFVHAQRTGSLPYFHKDPFDRLLIAQALVEGMTLVSIEKLFEQYGVDRIW